MNDITLISDKKISEMRQLLTDMKADLPVHIEVQEIQAKLTKVKYDALCVEGFTTTQALELCKL